MGGLRPPDVNHLIISSEPLQDESVWQELDEDAYVGVDWRMRLHHGRVDTIVPDPEDHQMV